MQSNVVRRSFVLLTVFAAIAMLVSAVPAAMAQQSEDKAKDKGPDLKAKDWTPLFDGKTLKGWKSANFGGEGEVKVKDGAIEMLMGVTLTGITWTDKEKPKMPTTNYELTLEGKRTDGGDFFCTTTIPVGKEFCSFVVGGWAGTVCGLSCVDWYDASDNMTTKFMNFKDDVWYRIRIRVSDTRIECWIGDEQFVDQLRKGHKFMIRDEVDLSKPLGISAWVTTGVVRDIRVRKMTPAEVKAAEAPSEGVTEG